MCGLAHSLANLSQPDTIKTPKDKSGEIFALVTVELLVHCPEWWSTVSICDSKVFFLQSRCPVRVNNISTHSLDFVENPNLQIISCMTSWFKNIFENNVCF